MSLESYQARGICVTSDTPSTSTNPNDDVQFKHKGFKDVTVIKSRSVFGSDEEMGPTSEYLPPAPKKKERALRKFERYSVIVRRVFARYGDRDMLVGTELCIQSPSLCRDFRKLVVDTHDSFDISSTPIVMRAPFYELFYWRKDLEAYVENETHQENHADVKLLYDFFRTDRLTIDNMATYDSMIVQGKISVQTLWTLYPPNKRLFLNTGEASECWLCRDVQRDPKNPLLWWVTGVQLGVNVRELGLTRRKHPISFARKIDGSMDISELPLVPEEYFDRAEQVKEEIGKRGKVFQDIMRSDLSGYAYRHYKGKVWFNKADDSAMSEADDSAMSVVLNKWNERVVVDYQQFLETHPNRAHSLEKFAKASRLRCPESVSDSDSDSDLDSDSGSDADLDTTPDAMSNSSSADVGEKNAFNALLTKIPKERGIGELKDLLLLTSPRMPAYGLKSKRWGFVLIENLSLVYKNDTPFDSLQIDPGMKSLVRSLVTGHQSGGTANDFDDVVTNKGKGLVMMLHGNPGIGKTLTAESIAELTASPLYSVSGGELSVDVKTVEDTVTSVFKLGKRWKAIILLDEADVVMSKRSSSELERNAIVAVWLRKLEYFEGILFLTTNRKDQLDAAFQSRIHLSIGLPDLSPEQRQGIWESFVTFNNSVADANKWKPEIYKVLGALAVNGRLIKNLLRTATYHARSTAPDNLMAPNHLYDVLKVELAEEPNIEEVLAGLRALIKQPESRVELGDGTPN